MDEVGPKEARDRIGAAKITVPLMAQVVIDRCMQIHEAAGLTADYPMAEAFNYARWCRQADGREPEGCPVAALGADLPRQPKKVRAVFTASVDRQKRPMKDV